MNLLVNFFEGCNERIMGKKTEGSSSPGGGGRGGGGETPLEGVVW